MTSRFSRFFLLGFFIFSFFASVSLPFSASAALVPCGRNDDAAIDETKPCTFCHLIVGGHNIIQYGLKIMTFVAIAVLVAMAIFYIVSIGNEGMMRAAKSGITAALAGFAIMLGAWLIINTTLRIMAVDEGAEKPLAGLRQVSMFRFTCDTASTAGTAAQGGTNSDAGGLMCQNPDVYKKWVKQGGSVCGSNTCSMPADKRNEILSKYGSIIDKYGGDRNIISVLIYQESKGNPNAHSSDGGCGLMQITDSAWTNGCSADILEPDENIRQGVALYKQKVNSVQGKNYGNGIVQKHMAFAAYNCCNNGEDPNAPSASCKVEDGWPLLPKWACPIDPGGGTFNACVVKDYACGVAACT